MVIVKDDHLSFEKYCLGLHCEKKAVDKTELKIVFGVYLNELMSCLQFFNDVIPYFSSLEEKW